MLADIDTKKFACWVISLSPQADNTLKILASLKGQGIEAQVFLAVDGRQGPPVLEADEYIDESLALIRNRKLLTDTELGCYLSHLRAVRTAYNDGYEFVCILEDDVAIEPHFAQVLRGVMPKELDLVRLMALKLRRRKVVDDLLPGVVITRPERGTLGTQAYVFNRVGMRKFLGHANRIYEAIDHVLDHFYLLDLDTYGVEPHAVYELTTPSSITKTIPNMARRPNVYQRLIYHPVKLYFSLRRHWYFFRHRADLYPNELPSKRPGKSARLRGKGAACAAILKSNP